MSRTFSWSLPLYVAGFLDCSLALYHFVLPYHMRWHAGLDGVADSLVWALFALNFSWSVLVLLVGLLVVYTARQAPQSSRFARVFLLVVGVFWLVHGAYTWLHPLPLPSALHSLGVALLAFPLVAAALHVLPLKARAESDT